MRKALLISFKYKSLIGISKKSKAKQDYFPIRLEVFSTNFNLKLNWIINLENKKRNILNEDGVIITPRWTGWGALI